MNFDFTSADPEKHAREELYKHLEDIRKDMAVEEYLLYRRYKLDAFNTIVQHIYKYQRGILNRSGGNHD